MSSETSMAASQCRLQEWAEQIRDCQSRPTGMTVVGWRPCHGITKANYYYRLRRVREACTEDCSCITGNSAAGEKERQCSTDRAGYCHKRIFHTYRGVILCSYAGTSPRGGDAVC